MARRRSSIHHGFAPASGGRRRCRPASRSARFSGLSSPRRSLRAATAASSWPRRAALIKVFDSLSDIDAVAVADLRPNARLLGPRRCSGWRSTRTSRAPVRLPRVHLRRAIGSNAPRWGDACAEPARRDGRRLRDQRPHLTARRRTRRSTEHVLVDDWCQQYPSHASASLAFGAARRALRERGRRRQLQLRRLGQAATRPTLRRPADGIGARDDPTARGRLAPRAGPAHRGDPARSTARSSRSIPTPAPASPATRCARSADANARRSSPTACATRSGSPSGPARASSGSATSAGTRGRRSTACPTRRSRRSSNFGWPCYEGAAAHRPGTLDNPNLRGPLRPGGATTAPYYAYRHSARVVPGESCPTRQLLDLRARLLRRRHVPGRVRRRPLLRGLRAQLHLGDAARARTACPTRRSARRSSPARRPRGPAGRPGRRPLLRRLAARHGPAHPALAGNRAPTAGATATPDRGPAPLRCVRRRRSSDPDGGR